MHEEPQVLADRLIGADTGCEVFEVVRDVTSDQAPRQLPCPHQHPPVEEVERNLCSIDAGILHGRPRALAELAEQCISVIGDIDGPLHHLGSLFPKGIGGLGYPVVFHHSELQSLWKSRCHRASRHEFQVPLLYPIQPPQEEDGGALLHDEPREALDTGEKGGNHGPAAGAACQPPGLGPTLEVPSSHQCRGHRLWEIAICKSALEEHQPLAIPDQLQLIRQKLRGQWVYAKIIPEHHAGFHPRGAAILVWLQDTVEPLIDELG